MTSGVKSNDSGLCGISFSSDSPDVVVEEMERCIRGAREKNTISITNTEFMYYALRDPTIFEYARRARFCLCDGMGVVLAGVANGLRIPRFNGPVLLKKCCEFGTSRGWRHYFYGGKPGVAERMMANLKAQYPEMIVVGCYTPPFREIGAREDELVLQSIRDAAPDVLWVGLGLRKQEAWIQNHIDSLDVPWLVGVGAAFDFHAGTARWAPGWIQRIGFEWLYRVCFEPRMLRRIARSFVFLIEATWRGGAKVLRRSAG